MLAEPSSCRKYQPPRDLVGDLLLGEGARRPSGKWPQKMIVNVQRLRTRLAVALPASVSRADGPGEQRQHHVVLEHLAAGLAADALGARASLLRRLIRLDALELEVVHATPHWKQVREQERRRPGCRAPPASTAAPRPCAGGRSRRRGPCRGRWCTCGAGSCASGATGRPGTRCPTRRCSTRRPGRGSSRTGRA